MDLTDLCGNKTGSALGEPETGCCAQLLSGRFAATSPETQLPTFFSFFLQRMALIRKTTKK